MLSSCPLVPTDCADKLPQTHFILMHAITDMDVHGEELRERPVGGRRTLREKRPQQTHVHVCSWFCDLGPMCPLGSLLTMVGAAGTLSSWGLVEGIQPLGGGTGVASSSPLPLCLSPSGRCSGQHRHLLTGSRRGLGRGLLGPRVEGALSYLVGDLTSEGHPCSWKETGKLGLDPPVRDQLSLMGAQTPGFGGAQGPGWRQHRPQGALW